MLSRVAESMYWLSRYLERAENVARFVDVHDALTMGGGNVVNRWEPLVATTGDQAHFDERYGAATRANVIRFLAFDREYPNSIVSCLERARENGRTIRDRLSLASWEELNKLYLFVSNAAETGLKGAAARSFFDQVKLHSHLLTGIFDNTLSHGELWHFARLGRFLERADKTSRILDVKYFILLPSSRAVGTPLDIIQWSALLQSTDCAIEYRRTHGRISPDRVVGFLMLNGRFPRSVRHCIASAEKSLHAITGCPLGTFSNEAEKRLGRLRSELDFSTTDDILIGGLHEYVDELQGKVNEVGRAVGEAFFRAEISKASGPYASPADA
ncbi:MAG: alpha-E domain-containing protein [Myxococcota bacterium]